MIIVVDTNIVFSAILNSSSKIAQILLYPSTDLEFYSTTQLLTEIEKYQNKIKKLSGYTDAELKEVKRLVIKNITFIDVEIIPQESFLLAKDLTKDIDVDDTEFVALTDFINGLLWSGDRKLIRGLATKGWQRCIDTNELFRLI
jgi:predicted nucleic acid-binding protein